MSPNNNRWENEQEQEEVKALHFAYAFRIHISILRRGHKSHTISTVTHEINIK